MSICKYIFRLIVIGYCLLSIPFAAAKPVLRIAFSDNKLPYSGHCQCGIEYDLVARVVEKMGYTLSPVFVPNKRMTLMLRSGEVDGIIGALENHPRANGFTSRPFIRYQNVALSLQSRRLQIQSFQDMKGMKIAAFQNAAFNLGDEYARLVASQPGYEEVFPQLLQNHLLYGGRVDVAITDLYIFLAANEAASEQVNVQQKLTTHPLFQATEYSVEFRDQAVRDSFNQHLKDKALRQMYQSLAEKYFTPLNNGPISAPLPNWMR